MSNNPYQSPRSDTSPNASPSRPKTALATWAIVLALLLGFSPLGADILFVASLSESVSIYAALVALFFVIIIAPLVVLYCRSGLAGFVAAPIRVTVTLLILALYLFVHISSLLRLAQ